ncbi:MAG: adenine-specific methyltransferase EcoRI family protein, partial [Porphyromonadaceae bacterium]|nr:adenine-specific methyltransferase EcoRI family protein [Porphyromonadaceae bacterium]
MANKNLKEAKAAKNDEFYTQYHDIEVEMNAYLEYNPDVFRDKTVLLPCDDPEWSNFTRFFVAKFEELGLKKLISTSFAQESKNYKSDWQPTLFETEDSRYNADKSAICGKIFILTRDANHNGKIDIDDLEWEYLEGTGDFRSPEVTTQRDGADIIITNPPFSLFREFLAWIMEGEKQFAIIGHMNAITYKEVFPLIKENKVWLGVTNFNTGMYFYVPKGFKYAETYKFDRERDGKAVNRVPGCCWYSNLEHGRRHEPLPLMTMEDNLRYNKKMQGKEAYDRYDNYDAIEVPYTDAIPKGYEGAMGVPISFLDKYCPEQFEILGC